MISVRWSDIWIEITYEEQLERITFLKVSGSCYFLIRQLDYLSAHLKLIAAGAMIADECD